MVSMANRLSTDQRARIVGCLVEGMSIRATVRVTGAAKNTVTKLLVDLGKACAEYQDAALVDLPCSRIECDEIWSFCYSKAKNVPEEHVGEFGYGDVWTWTAICADTKLVPSWLVGERNGEDAEAFMRDLASRLTQRVQLTTDGHKPYLHAVEATFGADVDYAMIHKIYGAATGAGDERRYSPGRLHRHREAHRHRQPGRGQGVHELRRAPEPHHADGHAALHPPDQRVQQEGREPGARRVAALHALQLRPAAQDADQGSGRLPDHPGHGGGRR